MAAKFLGVDFPFQKGPQGFPKPAVDAALVRANILQIVQTKPGERRMKPSFGVDLFAILFDDATSEETRSLVRSTLTTAIGQFEPRANILDISVEHVQAPGSLEGLDVTISYEFNREVELVTFRLGAAKSV